MLVNVTWTKHSFKIAVGGKIASSTTVEQSYRVDLLVADMRPTPNPAKNRPARKRGMLTAAVCRMTPKINTNDDRIRPKRRPAQSARGAAPRAPKKVPADRMETIVADCDAVTSK